MNRFIAALLGLIVCSFSLAQEPLRIAVAANFKAPLEEIVSLYQKKENTPIDIISGSTGKLYLQIINGAPYHIFLAADDERPAKLESEKWIIPHSRATYAVGQLVLTGKIIDTESSIETLLTKAKRLTISNPKVSPYGVASVSFLEKINLWQPLKSKMILGQDIAQTHQYIQRELVDLGIIALSQLLLDEKKPPYRMISGALHQPLQQQMVLLRNAAHRPEAEKFYAFLASDEAKNIIKKWGYQ